MSKIKAFFKDKIEVPLWVVVLIVFTSLINIIGAFFGL